MVKSKYEDIYKNTNTKKEYLNECKKQNLNINSAIVNYYKLVEMQTGCSVKEFK